MFRKIQWCNLWEVELISSVNKDEQAAHIQRLTDEKILVEMTKKLFIVIVPQVPPI